LTRSFLMQVKDLFDRRSKVNSLELDLINTIVKLVTNESYQTETFEHCIDRRSDSNGLHLSLIDEERHMGMPIGSLISHMITILA
jgi:hypothetical protein